MTFTQKDLLMKHFETHQQKPTHIVQKQQVVAQQQIQQQGKPNAMLLIGGVINDLQIEFP